MINLEGVRISDLSEPLGKFPCNRLSIFAAGVSFAIGNFSYYCVVLSTLHIKMLKVVTEVFLRKCRPASRKIYF